MKKGYNKQQEKTKVEEVMINYQRKAFNARITRTVTQVELDKDCFTLKESKAMITSKIHFHFHRN